MIIRSGFLKQPFITAVLLILGSGTGGAVLDLDLPVTVSEVMLGAQVEVPTFDGRVKLTVPAGSQSGTKLRLRGKGLPTRGTARGDLYAVVSIQVPSQLTPEQKRLWEQLAAESTFNPRKTP